jgi:hypothetical protein
MSMQECEWDDDVVLSGEETNDSVFFGIYAKKLRTNPTRTLYVGRSRLDLRIARSDFCFGVWTLRARPPLRGQGRKLIF